MINLSKNCVLVASLGLIGCATTAGHVPVSTADPTLSEAESALLASARAEREPQDAGQASTPVDEPAPSRSRFAPREPNPFRGERLLVYRLDIGQRLYDNDWDAVDEQLAVAASLTYEPEYWPLGLEAGVMYSTADGNQDGDGYRSTNLGLNFGGSKTFWPVQHRMLWTFGAGVALNITNDRIDVFNPSNPLQSAKDKDTWLAGYAHTRLAWRYSPSFDLGLDLQTMGGQDIGTIGPVRNSNNLQLMLSFGFHR